MLQSLIRAALSQRLLVVVVALVLCAFGLRESMRPSVDAFPDVPHVQLPVAPESHGRSPEELQRFVTVPPASPMTRPPRLVATRPVHNNRLARLNLALATHPHPDSTPPTTHTRLRSATVKSGSPGWAT